MGTVEIIADNWNLVTPENRDSYEIQVLRKDDKLVKLGRKYFLTEQLRRFMTNSILNQEGIRLEVAYDLELENEFAATIERKTGSGQVVYEIPKIGRVNADQIVDSLRALTDSILEIERVGKPAGVDYSAMINALGYAGRPDKNSMKTFPWEIGR